MGMEIPEITNDVAEIIINKLVETSGYGGSMPESEKERVDFATVIVSQVYAKRNMDPDDEFTKEIIAIAEGKAYVANVPDTLMEEELSVEGSLEEESTEVVIDAPIHLEPSPEAVKEIADNIANKEGIPQRSLQDALKGVRETLTKENLPEPFAIDKEPEPLPVDLTELDNTSIRQLFSQFNACHLRMAWLKGIEESHLSDCEIAAKNYFTEALDDIEKFDTKGKTKQITLLKEEAALNDKYKEWMEKADYHRSRHRMFKLLAEIYDKACERLSREWTMRTDQFNQSGK